VSGNLSVNTDQISELTAQLQVFPNPFTSELTVHTSLPQKSKTGILRLFNQWGQLLQQVSVSSDRQELRLGQDLPAGIYIISLESPQYKPIAQKVVKQ
jgi:hypothetical protein